MSNQILIDALNQTPNFITRDEHHSKLLHALGNKNAFTYAIETSDIRFYEYIKQIYNKEKFCRDIRELLSSYEKNELNEYDTMKCKLSNDHVVQIALVENLKSYVKSFKNALNLV